MNVKYQLPTSGTVVDVELADFRGTPIEVGSKIAYVIGQNSAKKLVEAEVLQLIPYDDWDGYSYNGGNHLRSANYIDKKMNEEGFDQENFDEMKKLLSTSYTTKVARKGEKFDRNQGKYVPSIVKATLPDSSRLVVIK